MKLRREIYESMGICAHQAAAPAPEPSYPGELTYGIVAITAGRHKGKIGYYDDDELGCIVYFDRPMLDGYFVVKPSSMRPATDAEVRIYIEKIRALGVELPNTSSDDNKKTRAEK